MILDASEDFKRRTLRTLPTILEKLVYICSLQTGEGLYRHWGLSRIFGEQKAQDAISSTHREVAVELIRVPIKEIYEEFLDAKERPAGAELLNPQSFVLNAPSNDDELLSAHLRLIRDSMESLARQERKVRKVA